MTCVHNTKIALAHIPKAGGQSIAKWMLMTVPNLKELPVRHTALHLWPQFGINPASIGKIIAVIRNPYARELSQWTYWKEEFKAGKHHESSVRVSTQTFREFLLDEKNIFTVEDKWKVFGGFYRFWLVDKDNKIPANVHIVRMEDMEELMKIVKPYQVLQRPMPHINTSEHTDWREHYTPELKKIVNERYSDELAWKFYEKETM